MKKITVLGDIMIELPVLKAAKRADGYNFDSVFARVRDGLKNSDYVIGNLETPLAGEDAGYTKSHLCFNAPDAYAESCKKAGIDLLSTANNHTFDRGYAGMERTIEALDRLGISHTGSFLPGQERPEAFYFELDGTKCALIAYTYGTNYGGSGGDCLAEGEYAGTVNLLRPQQESSYLPGVQHGSDWVDKVFSRLKLNKDCLQDPKWGIKRFLGMETTYSRADDRLDEQLAAPYIAQMQNDIRTAKQKADVVLFYPHVGGQFNVEPGKFSEFVVQKAVEAGADAVICTHSHIPQKLAVVDGVPCAYCLGNFNMNPESYLAMPEILTNYGYCMHFYVEAGKIQKVTFSMMKNVTEKDGQISSYPVQDLLEATAGKEKTALQSDVAKLYQRITGNKMPDGPVLAEYEIAL